MSASESKPPSKVICRNWSEYPSVRDVILRIREMDLLCFGKLQDEDWGTPEGWMAIAKKNPFMNVCLEVDGVIIGSVHWLWLNRSARDRYLRGELRDGLVRAVDTVATPPHHEPTYLYLLSMLVHPDFQGRGYLRKLWNHASAELISWQEKGMMFEDAFATAWSTRGMSIISGAGGKVIGLDRYGHRMYHLPTPIRKLTSKKQSPTSTE